MNPNTFQQAEMTSRVATAMKNEWSNNPTKTLKSTAAFNNQFYLYSESIDTNTLQRRGYLSVNPKATAGNSPSGRTLIVNGKRLVPGVNPMTDFGSTGLGPSPGKFLLGVYDPVSGLNGFIDPTSATFNLSDTNRPSSDYLVDIAAGQSLAKAASLGSASYGASSGGATVVSSGGKVLVPYDPLVSFVLTTVTDSNIRPSSVIFISFADRNGNPLSEPSFPPMIINPTITTGSFDIYTEVGWNVFYAVFN